ncbi:hypothetical protein A8709_08625 [Paenibacillus pectinilyticus]|uniref:DUF3502 domain-containing protein n=1 Tax=Paenibacillus pectinilyticus TaxID=512399 RepID=A0A1C1A812_9BACL|nr:ABC transporter substrate-binding protein [Paenibacillus pectinilyticus]OCT16718.1 hypothetical protein A8709_08625 [Paenibacillus pectinilyticus]
MQSFQKSKKLNITVVTALALMLSACSNNSGNNEVNSNSASPSTSTASSTASSEPYEIVMAIPGTEQKDLGLVLGEANKVLKEKKINATLKIQIIPFSNYLQQLSLKASSGEKLDLMVTLGTFGYTTQAANGWFAPLDDLIKQSGQDILSKVGQDYMNATKVKGVTYAIPTIHDLVQGQSFAMRKDLVDKYKIDVASIKKSSDLEKAFEVIKTNQPAISPAVPLAAGVSIADGMQDFDPLGDKIGVMMDYDQLKVTNLYESAKYKELLTLIHKWYKAGYILPDAATNQIAFSDLIKSGRAFGNFRVSTPGGAASDSRKTGTEMITVPVVQPVATTATATSVMLSISHNSQDKAKVMQFLNLLYTDKAFMNLLSWGIEGKHYIKKSENVITFPEGVNATNNGYYPNWNYMMGNEFLSYTFEGDNPDLWTAVDQYNKSAIKSKALGFTYDSSPVSTEITAINNVINQYKMGLETGTIDPEGKLPEFQSRLKAAGIDKVIAEKQKQLDEWAKANNK